jgi:hypothetical protein
VAERRYPLLFFGNGAWALLMDMKYKAEGSTTKKELYMWIDDDFKEQEEVSEEEMRVVNGRDILVRSYPEHKVIALNDTPNYGAYFVFCSPDGSDNAITRLPNFHLKLLQDRETIIQNQAKTIRYLQNQNLMLAAHQAKFDRSTKERFFDIISLRSPMPEVGKTGKEIDEDLERG